MVEVWPHPKHTTEDWRLPWNKAFTPLPRLSPTMLPPQDPTAEAVSPGCAGDATCSPPSDAGTEHGAALPPPPPAATSAATTPPVAACSFSAAGADAAPKAEKAALSPLPVLLLLLPWLSLLPAAQPRSAGFAAFSSWRSPASSDSKSSWLSC